MPATEAAARIRRRELSPVEYLDAVLAHAEAQQTRLNPFMTVCAERARDEARAAERAVLAGDRLGDRKSTRLNSSHSCASRMPPSACKKKTHHPSYTTSHVQPPVQTTHNTTKPL